MHKRTSQQEKIWVNVKDGYQTLIDANGNVEKVFGNSLKQSFVDSEKLANGEAKICVGCMDERVPSPEGGMKLGVAGSGVLMTKIPEPDQLRSMTGEQIYAYLEDVTSGDENFWKLVASLQEKIAGGADITVSSHEGCGAVGIFCGNLEKALAEAGNPLTLDRQRVADAAAARLHAALKLSGSHRKANFSKKADIPMDGDHHMHDAFAMVLDFSGRNNGQLTVRIGKRTQPLRSLFISGRFSPDWEYLKMEVKAGLGILAGGHAAGIEEAPVLIIADPSHPEFTGSAVIQNLGDSLGTAKALVVNAPSERNS